MTLTNKVRESNGHSGKNEVWRMIASLKIIEIDH